MDNKTISGMYAVIREAVQRQFPNDTEEAIDDFLHDQFEKTQYAN